MLNLYVGIFCPTLNVYGGGEFVALTIAKTLAQNNYDVTLFVNEQVNPMEIQKFFGENLPPFIKTIVKPSLAHPRGLIDFYQTIIRSYIFKLKCDIWVDAYSNRIFPWSNIIYIHFPFLNHFHYRPKFPYLKSRNFLAIASLPYVMLEKNLRGDRGKLILTNSQYTAEEIRRFSGRKVEVLYPPVPSINFDINLTKNGRKNMVVSISRFEPGKGLEKIPYIASLTDSDIQFAIIGRLHYRNTLLSLQKLITGLGLKDRVKLFPDATRLEMKQILRNAKIYLHTMIGEHFGISIVEAMAMGCIPIVHDSGGPKEYVPQEFRYKTVHEAAKKITKEIQEWTDRKALKILKIAEKFREEKFSIRFMELFRRYEESIYK